MDDKYFWSAESSVKIEDFVKKFRPSIIDDRDTPWIWVQGSDNVKVDPERITTQAGSLLEAKRILDNLEARIQEIETDESIPNRAKKGQKSKKAVRDEAHEGARESLKNLSKASKWTVGKWLLFPKHEAVDGLWSTIAQSVASGPLKEAGVFLAKVAPTPSSPTSDFITHVICMYMHDVYDLAVVKKVLITLLSQHGIEPSAVKSDLYTLAGIDSHHPTKLRSSIWRPTELVDGGKEGIEKLKDAYHANKSKTKPKAGSGEKQGSRNAVGKDGILESDSEDERLIRENKKKRKAQVDVEETKEDKPEPEVKKPVARQHISKAMKFKEDDIFAGGSDSE